MHTLTTHQIFVWMFDQIVDQILITFLARFVGSENTL